jgi:hypothetical protein
MVAFWKDAHDEGGLAWDDSNNNRAFLSGTCSATLNGASIYIEALRKPDNYKTEAGVQLKEDILHAALPKGPGGQFSYHVPFSNLLMGEPGCGEEILWLDRPLTDSAPQMSPSVAIAEATRVSPRYP